MKTALSFWNAIYYRMNTATMYTYARLDECMDWRLIMVVDFILINNKQTEKISHPTISLDK